MILQCDNIEWLRNLLTNNIHFQNMQVKLAFLELFACIYQQRKKVDFICY